MGSPDREILAVCGYETVLWCYSQTPTLVSESFHRHWYFNLTETGVLSLLCQWKPEKCIQLNFIFIWAHLVNDVKNRLNSLKGWWLPLLLVLKPLMYKQLQTKTHFLLGNQYEHCIPCDCFDLCMDLVNLICATSVWVGTKNGSLHHYSSRVTYWELWWRDHPMLWVLPVWPFAITTGPMKERQLRLVRRPPKTFHEVWRLQCSLQDSENDTQQQWMESNEATDF